MKIIIPLLVFTLAFPAVLFAEPPENSDGNLPPKVTGLQKGEAAPYSGVLLNTTAAAQIFTDKSFFSEELCALRVQFEVQKKVAEMQLFLDSAAVTIDSMDKKYNAIITIKDKEIDKLNAIALESSNDYNTWWAAGGILTGIALTLAVLFAAKEI
jgi:hypothetical protein